MAEMPERTRSRAEMDADYADRFAIEVPGAHGSARPWAHLILEQTASGRSAPRLWTFIGVSLGPRPSPDHVQGWRVIADHETWVVLGASTPYLHARAVIEAEDGELSVALFVRYRLRLGAAVWWPISVLHRRGVPVMLLQARRLGGPRRGHL